MVVKEFSSELVVFVRLLSLWDTNTCVIRWCYIWNISMKCRIILGTSKSSNIFEALKYSNGVRDRKSEQIQVALLM